uniref:hypothetical protein n=1 Tax=Phaeostrophion irregulare TaxID=243268 RepID=UPI002E763B7B|nr:hypothetical protein V2492_pgp006 [Phaeostrophion irregulare]WAM64380.1 hypothetical protein [Phaeostrophion irregulare]
MKLKAFYITLDVNGQKYKIFMVKPIAILSILNFLEYQKQLNLIEYNGKIQNELNKTSLYIKQNAKIEIITIVGGG